MDSGATTAADHVWRVDPNDVCIAQHCVLGKPLLPMAYVLVRAARLCSTRSAHQWFTMDNFSALGAVPVASTVDVRIDAKRRRRDLFLRFCVDDIPKFTAGVVSDGVAVLDKAPTPAVEADVIYDCEEVYRRYATHGFAYGPAFRRIQTIAASGERAWATIDGRDLPEGEAGDVLLWDNVLQSLIGAQLSVVSAAKDTYLPVFVSHIHAMSVFPRCSDFGVSVTLRDIKRHAGLLRLDAAMFSDSGTCIAVLKGISLKKV